MGQGDLGRATAWCEESLALARQLGEPLHIVMPLANLASVAYLQGDLQRAEAQFAVVAAMDRQAGDLLLLAHDPTLWADTRRRPGAPPPHFKLLRGAVHILQD